MVEMGRGPVRRVALVCALVFAFGLARPARAGCSLALAADIPLAEEGHSFVVEVGINGQKAKLLLDTGSYSIALNAASTARLGLSVTGGFRENYGLGGKRAKYDTWAALRLGRLRGDHTHMDVLDMWQPKPGDDVDGLFGMNLMAAYDVDLDIPGGHLRLYAPEGACASPAVALADPLYAAKLLAVDNDIEADIGVGIDGHMLRAQLDSGAATTTIFRRGAERLGLDLTSLSQPGVQTGHGIGPAAVPVIRHVFPIVDIGGLEIRNMPIEIVAQRDTGIDRTHTGSRLVTDQTQPGGAEMLLGRDFLRQVHVWISHSSQTLVMQFPPKPSPALP